MRRMKYNPEKHHRRSIRLKGYDYSQPGWYFVTVVTQNREMLFGVVVNDKMVLDLFGKIIDYHWRKLPRHFKNIVLDEYQIMPNHFHGIIHIVGAMHSDLNNQKNNENFNGNVGAMHSDLDNQKNNEKFNGNVGAMHSDLDNQKNNEKFNGNASPLSQPRRPHGTVPGSLGAIMQNFQSVTTRKINRIRKTPGARLWQRNYWEHIIRNETELNRIRNYIINNPKNWDEDRFSF